MTLEARTEQDRQIAELFAADLKGREIAERIGLPESTVWARIKHLGLGRRGKYVHLEGGRLTVAQAMARAKRIGPVEVEEADLDDGRLGYIAFIDDQPGCACATKIAALRSALAAAQVGGVE